MPSNFWRIALLRAARLFDLVAVCLAFLAAFALASGSFTWPSFAEVLLLRIKVINFIAFWQLPYGLLNDFLALRFLSISSPEPRGSAGP